MTAGERVSLVAYGGRIIERVVVKDLGDLILVSKSEELACAIVEKRAPVSVGFPKSAVLQAK